MTQVTGFTAARMKAIEDSTVVSGDVRGDDLILITRDGTEILAGDVRGPAGPSGGGGGDPVEKIFSFSTASETWVCEHNLDSLSLDITTFDPDGNKVEGDVAYLDRNTVSIGWYYPTSGVCYISS